MKTDMEQQTPNNIAADSVKDRVLHVIEEKGVCPRSKYVFWCQNWLVWGLWVFSIMFGALAIAVLLFVSTHRYYDIYEATHENFFTFILEALPYLWFVVFGAMLALAAWQLKHTKRGYRLSTSVLGVSSFAFSIILGGLFHLGGFGWSLDMWLGTVAPMYTSQAEMERKMWQNPAQGRLVGRIDAKIDTPLETTAFRDIDNHMWLLQLTDLSPMDTQYLKQGGTVRLLGVVMEAHEGNNFYTCGVFPWMLDKPAKMAQISEERKMFVDRMYLHYENAEARKQAIAEELAESSETAPKDSPCYQLAAVRRVHEGMQP